jgi:gamma-glutamylcyclotransferase (GGCT)/AIG2-like uncharacterized protein YtfP
MVQKNCCNTLSKQIDGSRNKVVLGLYQKLKKIVYCLKLQKNMYLFVYGTLKSNFDNEMANFLHHNASLLGEATIGGRLYLLGWYPGLVLDHTAYPVKGEVYCMNTNSENILKKLDTYEGVDSGDYRRVLRPVTIANEVINCWIYETLIESEIEITSGEFLTSSN